MEISIPSSALTALFVGMAWALVKTVEYFVSRKSTKGSQVVPFHEGHSEQLSEIHDCTKQLCEQHAVYDENHVPLWYFPREMLVLMREMHACVETTESRIEEIKTGQAVLFEKMTELISSQMLLTQRIGDLIAKLDRISN